jgi:hypothetical protein
MKTLLPSVPIKPKEPPPGAPPSGVTPSQLVAMLQELPRPHKIVSYPRKLPGTDQPIAEIAMVAAFIQDKINAQASAHAYTRQILADPRKSKEDGKTKMSEEEMNTLGYEGVFRNAVAIELLYRACKDPRDKSLKAPVFPGATWMRNYCTDDEIGVLTATYLRTQMEIGPIISMLSNAECDLWIEKLIAGGEASDPFDSLASDAKTDLILRLVWHLRTYRTARSSSGRPLDSGSSDSESSTEYPTEPEAEAVQVDFDEPPPVDPLPELEVDPSAPVPKGE